METNGLPLPKEVFLQIAKHFDAKSICNAKATCKIVNALIGTAKLRPSHKVSSLDIRMNKDGDKLIIIIETLDLDTYGEPYCFGAGFEEVHYPVRNGFQGSTNGRADFPLLFTKIARKAIKNDEEMDSCADIDAESEKEFRFLSKLVRNWIRPNVADPIWERFMFVPVNSFKIAIAKYLHIFFRDRACIFKTITFTAVKIDLMKEITCVLNEYNVISDALVIDNYFADVSTDLNSVLNLKSREITVVTCQDGVNIEPMKDFTNVDTIRISALETNPIIDSNFMEALPPNVRHFSVERKNLASVAMLKTWMKRIPADGSYDVSLNITDRQANFIPAVLGPTFNVSFFIKAKIVNEEEKLQYYALFPDFPCPSSNDIYALVVQDDVHLKFSVMPKRKFDMVH